MKVSVILSLLAVISACSMAYGQTLTDGDLVIRFDNGLWRIDSTSGMHSVMATQSPPDPGVAVDPEGFMYTGGDEASHLYRTDLFAGAAEQIGSLGYDHFAVEPSGTLLASWHHQLYRVNPRTGQATAFPYVLGYRDDGGEIFVYGFAVGRYGQIYVVNVTYGSGFYQLDPWTNAPTQLCSKPYGCTVGSWNKVPLTVNHQNGNIVAAFHDNVNGGTLLYVVDPALPQAAQATSVPLVVYPVSVAIAQTGMIYLLDSGFMATRNVVAVDPCSGTQTVLTQYPNDGFGGTGYGMDIYRASAPTLKWTGTAGSSWTQGDSSNWQQRFATATYVDGQAVTFDDTGDMGQVSISTSVSPASVRVVSGQLPYTFTGGPITGNASLTKDSYGTLILANGNSYTGGTVIEAGTLVIAADNRLPIGGSVEVKPEGVLDLYGFNQTVAAISGQGRISLGAGVLTVSGSADSIFQGTIDGQGSLDKEGAGTLILGPGIAHTGSTHVGGGVLDLSGGLASTGGVITVGAGGVLRGVGTVARDVVNNGQVQGPTGNEWLTFTGVVSGAGAFSGNVQFDGLYVPATQAHGIISGNNMQFGPSSTLQIEMSGQTDLLQITGAASLSGDLRLPCTSGYVPQVGQEFTILTAGSVTGTFGSFAVSDRLQVTYGPTNVNVRVARLGQPPLPVGDLLAKPCAVGGLNLTWTATGDEGSLGTAAAYDLRYSTSPIDESNFAAATRVTEVPAPKVAGQNEAFTVTGLTLGVRYYFALKVLGQLGPSSAISNMASAMASSPGINVVLQDGLPGYTGCSDTYIDPSDAAGCLGELRSLRVTGAAYPQGGCRTLIRFDMGSIPPGTVIAKAMLSLRSSDPSCYGSQGFYGAYPLTRSWSEWESSWKDAASGTRWTTPGGDFAVTPDAISPMQAVPDVWYDFDVTARVRQWINDPAANFGWCVKCTRYVDSYDSFYSRQATDAQTRPKLTISYFDITPPMSVDDLLGSPGADGCVNLTWTATGDDGNVGTTTRYDLRYSTSPITGVNFNWATPVSPVPTPKTAGSPEAFIVTGLTGGMQYYFAIKAIDENENVSEISNVASSIVGSPDLTAPLAVGDLLGSPGAAGCVNLTWTATGDDGNAGTAAAYELRYSTNAITEVNFADATAVSGLSAPKAAGSSESFVIPGLTGGVRYYFALKVTDDAGNISGVSNVASITVPFLIQKTLQNGLAGYSSCSDNLVESMWPTSTLGGLTYMAISGSVINGNTQQTLVRFDLGSIPSTTSIVQATLSLYSNDQNNVRGSTGFYGAYPLARSWAESTSSWNLAASGSPWTTPGGDFADTPDAVSPKQGVSRVWYDFDVTARVQQWIVDGSTNFGWCMKCTDESLSNRDLFESAQSATAQWRPKLVVYWIDTAPGAVTDLAAPPGGIGRNSMQLTWTATGDSGSVGTAGRYDLRSSTNPITDMASFNAATPIAGVPAPQPASSAEQFTVTGLAAGTTYYFAIVVYDAINQVSDLSNVVQVTTRPPRKVGDANDDGYVNVGDLQVLVAAWGSNNSDTWGNWNPNADFNSDGFINVGDLQLLVANWGQ